jgi:membrane protein YqaA with SNARE-associated domain
MLAPMTLAKPRLWARYATISLCGSLLGSFVGYALGHYAFQLARPLIEDLGWMPKLNEIIDKLHDQSPWKTFGLLVLAGFIPIPLKIFSGLRESSACRFRHSWPAC